MANVDDAIEALRKQSNQAAPDVDEAIEMLRKRSADPQDQPMFRPPPASQDADPTPGAMTGPPNDPSMIHGPEPEPEQGMMGKLVGRAFGTDVNDPMPWTRIGATVAGSVAGGMTGAKVPGPPQVKALGAFGGGVVGGAAGAIAPEATMEGLESLGALPEGYRKKHGLSNEDLQTIFEGELLLGVALGGAISGVRATSRGISNLMTGANRGTREIAEAATREGIAMLPVQVGERTFARGFVSVMGRFPWVASKLKRRAERSMGQIENAFRGVPERFGPLTTFDEASARILRESNHTVTAINRAYEEGLSQIMSQASMRGMTVRPVNTRTVTSDLMRMLERETPRGLNETRGRLTKGAQNLRRFLTENTAILSEGTEIADLPIRQANTLLKNIDEFMVSAARNSDATTMSRIERLRQAVQMDMLGNVTERGRSTPASDAIMAEFARLDNEQTQMVHALLESTAARRIGIKTHPGGRSATEAGTSTQSTDSLARVLLRDSSPEIVDEVSRITSPQTMREITSAVMNEATQGAFTRQSGNVIHFDVDTFARSLGLDDVASGKYRQTQRLMEHSGGMAMDDLQQLVEVARRASRAEIPDVSTFIARRATIGGIGTAMKTMAPWMIVGASAGASGSLVGGIIAIGGSRLLSNMISDPRSARALSRVIHEEARSVVKRSAAIRGIAFAVNNMQSAGEITRDTANGIMETYEQFSQQMIDLVEQNDGQTK